jgi:dihydrofolate synthase / folylpolyglutamate synthase
MDYKQTTEWLFNQLPMYQRLGKAAYKADLSNTVKILAGIGNPENSFKAIHIAGTNGKGSVSHIIASVLQEAGYKIGLYTSPHLKDFRERIKVNGELISEEHVVKFVNSYRELFTDISSSFFEMTVGMAFDFFAKQKVDFAVVETGLGGRLDSTNLCKPIITIITNIGIDHTTFLGDTTQKIAWEKAGIIKKNIPVVIGKHQHDTDIVFTQKADEIGSQLIFAEDILELRQFQSDLQDYQLFDVWYKNELIIDELKSPLLGHYQKENLCTAIYSVKQLSDNSSIALKTEHIRHGIENVVENTGITGRWQKISNNPTTIADTGHNIDGIKAIITQISSLSFNQLHFVLGMVNDKDIFSILNILPKNATYYFCKPSIPRGLEEDRLAELGFKAGLNGKPYTSVKQALYSARNNSGVNDMIFIGGSTFVVAEVI